MTKEAPSIYIGIDSGATTSKVGAVGEDGTIISTRLLQRPTQSEEGPDAVVDGWVEAVDEYLVRNELRWEQVRAAGLAIPGPFQRYGVLDRSANLPVSFEGFDVHNSLSEALLDRVGRVLPVTVGNDGNMGGVAEAHRVRGTSQSTVVMLAPGSGLGCAYVGRDGFPLDGDTLAGMEAGHMPAPLQLLDVPPYPCGCGRTWGCIEVYTTLSGLPYLLDAKLEEHPEHTLARSTAPMKEKAMALRGLAQDGDALALELFDFQARALGYHVANLTMALDAEYVVVGGGLMDPEATTVAFRKRYLNVVRETAMPYLWPAQQDQVHIVAATLGDLSPAVGAALVALYKERT